MKPALDSRGVKRGPKTDLKQAGGAERAAGAERSFSDP